MQNKKENKYPGLEEYIALHYIEPQRVTPPHMTLTGAAMQVSAQAASCMEKPVRHSVFEGLKRLAAEPLQRKEEVCEREVYSECDEADFEEYHADRLNERMNHLTDTYSQYLMYLIKEKKLENAEVWKNALVDKKIFSKIKNNVNYHPNKQTALCLCVGAKLNLDESRDLLARAGYALSPCDKTDIIFSYFIENEIYDMIELDIQLEEHGLPCIVA